MKKDDIFDKISPNEALEILRQITKTDKNLKNKIIDLVENKNIAHHIATNAKSTFESKYNFQGVLQQSIFADL